MQCFKWESDKSFSKLRTRSFRTRCFPTNLIGTFLNGFHLTAQAYNYFSSDVFSSPPFPFCLSTLSSPPLSTPLSTSPDALDHITELLLFSYILLIMSFFKIFFIRLTPPHRVCGPRWRCCTVPTAAEYRGFSHVTTTVWTWWRAASPRRPTLTRTGTITSVRTTITLKARPAKHGAAH